MAVGGEKIEEQSNMNGWLVIAACMAVSWVTMSAADSTRARCDIYQAGQDHTETMIPCILSQRQG